MFSVLEISNCKLKVSEYCPPGQYEIPQNNFVLCLSYSHYKLINFLTYAASFNNEAAKQTFSFNNQDYQVSENSADPDQTLTALANSEDPDQRSLIRTFFVCFCVCIF